MSDKVDFLHADQHQTFLAVDFNTFPIKVSYKVILSILMDMVKHYQSTSNNMFAIPSQYLKKKQKKTTTSFCDGVHFSHGNKHQVSTSWQYHF